MLDLSGVYICNSSCFCSGCFELRLVCQSVCGMFDAARLLWWLTEVLFRTRNEDQACFQWASIWEGHWYVWVSLLYRDLRVGNWTPKSGNDMFYLLSYMPQLYFGLWRTQKHICFTDQRRTWNETDLNANPDTQHGARTCVPECLVCRCLC